jgi:hypothetical protein
MTLGELKTLLALNGRQRIPYAEVEIFADKELCICYLIELNRAKHWSIDSINSWPEDADIFDIDKFSAYLVYSYARYAIKNRWPEAEHIIKTGIIYIGAYNDHFGTNI